MVWWIALAAVALILAVGAPVAWRNARRARSRLAPNRVRAVIVGDPQVSANGSVIECTVRFQHPSAGPVLAPLRETTVGRAYLPHLADGTTVAVFTSVHDVEGTLLDWSAFGTKRGAPDPPALDVWAPMSPEDKARSRAEAVTWQVTCTTCTYTRSLWEAGGIGGDGLRVRATDFRCPACAATRAHRLWHPIDA